VSFENEKLRNKSCDSADNLQLWANWGVFKPQPAGRIIRTNKGLLLARQLQIAPKIDTFGGKDI
jgi:hypothetical protein